MKRAWLLGLLVGCADTPTTNIDWLVTGTVPGAVAVMDDGAWTSVYPRQTADGYVYALPRPFQGDDFGLFIGCYERARAYEYLLSSDELPRFQRLLTTDDLATPCGIPDGPRPPDPSADRHITGTMLQPGAVEAGIAYRSSDAPGSWDFDLPVPVGEYTLFAGDDTRMLFLPPIQIRDKTTAVPAIDLDASAKPVQHGSVDFTNTGGEPVTYFGSVGTRDFAFPWPDAETSLQHGDFTFLDIGDWSYAFQFIEADIQSGGRKRERRSVAADVVSALPSELRLPDHISNQVDLVPGELGMTLPVGDIDSVVLEALIGGTRTESLTVFGGYIDGNGLSAIQFDPSPPGYYAQLAVPPDEADVVDVSLRWRDADGVSTAHTLVLTP